MGTVQTVCGNISDRELGPTLVHEHLFCDFSSVGGNPDNRLQNWELIVEELVRFKTAGGRAIFELTPHGLGDSPSALKRISDAAEVHIVHGTAFYIAETYPEWVRSATVEQIADFFVDNIETGQHGIRAGLIGEIASHNDIYPNDALYRLYENEERVFRAAALAQKRTGAAISTHASRGRPGHAQLDILEAAGADPSRVVIGHCDTYVNENEEADFDYYLPILKRGAGVQFDLIGWRDQYPLSPTDEQRAQRLAALISRGFADRLTLSTDTCRLTHFHAHGGRGLDYLWQTFLPLLRGQGVGDKDINQILVGNPRRLAAIH